jgi:hypothetical protein
MRLRLAWCGQDAEFVTRVQGPARLFALQVTAAKNCHSPGTPRSLCRTRSSKRGLDPATKSLTVLDASLLIVLLAARHIEGSPALPARAIG